VRLRVIAHVAVLTISPRADTVPTGLAAAFKATLEDAADAPIAGRLTAWHAADSLVARVGALGGVVGGRPGTTAIIAESEGHADTVVLTVVPRPTLINFTIPAGLQAGDSVQLSPVVTDSFGTVIGLAVQMSSTTPAVAAVGPTNVLHIFGAGDIVVEARAGDLLGHASARTAPVQLSGPSSAYDFWCAVSATALAYCWSYSNYDGRLGNPQIPIGAASTFYSPTVVAVPPPVRAVAPAIGDFACALTASGDAWCWGSASNNYGELGVPSAGPCVAAPGATCRNGPVLVSGGITWNRLAAGWDHVCGLDMGGAVWCWGNNADGQLGQGTTGGSLPAPASVATPVPFTAIASGAAFTCGLGTDSLAYCWGQNTYGMLGDSSSAAGRSSPGPVAGGHHFASLTAGWNHVCALEATGTAWCWGSNLFGELGTPVAGAGAPCVGGTACNGVPEPVDGSIAFATLAAGVYRTCGLDGAGNVYCWGLHNTANLNTPTLLGAAGTATQLSLRDQLCLVGTDAKLRCGDPAASQAPVLVNGQ